MVDNPLVSVVMPAYNAAAYIDEAVESMLAQTYQNWELLIADDASTDNTKAVLGKYQDPRILFFHNGKNLGYQSTCNKLFALCKGDFITFLDADDYCPANRLSLLLAPFAQNPNLGMVGSAYHIVDNDKNLIDTVYKPLTYAEIREHLPKESAFCGATIMFSRRVYETVGGYRDFFKNYAYQDYDWSYCIADKFESINLAEPLYSYRQSPESNSKKISAQRFVSDKIVQYLGNQRATQGKDDIETQNLTALNAFVQKLLAPFEADTSLIYRQYAAVFMYNKLYKKAKNAAWQAIKLNPTQLINYRTWFYCFRKSLFK